MPLTEQEIVCIDLTCRYLSATVGGDWTICPGPTLDEAYPDMPTPEVRISNGSLTAAVEVKRLTGDQVENEYRASLLSLRRSLAPSCGGHYYLCPPINFQLPASPQLRRLLKREIERVAPTLGIGDHGAIRIPRRGLLRGAQRSGPGYIFCMHNDSDVLRQMSSRLSGVFILIDGGWEHSFVTEQAKADFAEALAVGGELARQQGSAPVQWHEEWELTRVEDRAHEGVWVIAATRGREVHRMVEAAVESMLEKAIQKFAARRWADRNVVVFERQQYFMTADRIREVMRELEGPGLALLNLVLLVDGETIEQVWPDSG